MSSKHAPPNAELAAALLSIASKALDEGGTSERVLTIGLVGGEYSVRGVFDRPVLVEHSADLHAFWDKEVASDPEVKAALHFGFKSETDPFVYVHILELEDQVFRLRAANPPKPARWTRVTDGLARRFKARWGL